MRTRKDVKHKAPQGYYNTRDAAKYLKPPVEPNRIRSLRSKQKRFPNAIKSGREIFIPKSDLDNENEKRKHLIVKPKKKKKSKK